MNQSKIQSRILLFGQIGNSCQRLEISRVQSVLGDRHVNVVYLPVNFGQQNFRHLRQQSGIFRLHEMAMSEITVAEMEAHLDVLVDVAITGVSNKAIVDAIFDALLVVGPPWSRVTEVVVRRMSFLECLVCPTQSN